MPNQKQVERVCKAMGIEPERPWHDYRCAHPKLIDRCLTGARNKETLNCPQDCRYFKWDFPAGPDLLAAIEQKAWEHPQTLWIITTICQNYVHVAITFEHKSHAPRRDAYVAIKSGDIQAAKLDAMLMACEAFCGEEKE